MMIVEVDIFLFHSVMSFAINRVVGMNGDDNKGTIL